MNALLHQCHFKIDSTFQVVFFSSSLERRSLEQYRRGCLSIEFIAAAILASIESLPECTSYDTCIFELSPNVKALIT